MQAFGNLTALCVARFGHAFRLGRQHDEATTASETLLGHSSMRDGRADAGSAVVAPRKPAKNSAVRMPIANREEMSPIYQQFTPTGFWARNFLSRRFFSEGDLDEIWQPNTVGY